MDLFFSCSVYFFPILTTRVVCSQIAQNVIQMSGIFFGQRQDQTCEVDGMERILGYCSSFGWGKWVQLDIIYTLRFGLNLFHSGPHFQNQSY